MLKRYIVWPTVSWMVLLFVCWYWFLSTSPAQEEWFPDVQLFPSTAKGGNSQLNMDNSQQYRHCNTIPMGNEWESFKSMVEILNTVGANYTISGGTVLGWYRDCSLSGNDDLDFTVEIKWFIDNHEKLEAALNEAGWHQIHTFAKGQIGYEEAWKKAESLKVDIFSEAYVSGEYITGITIEGTTYPCYKPHESRQIHTWHNLSFPVPAPIEAYLVALYGTTWTVKKKESWDGSPFETENGRRSCEKKRMPNSGK